MLASLAQATAPSLAGVSGPMLAPQQLSVGGLTKN